MKPLEKIRARDLRQKGWSIKNIAKELVVSPSTVSLWVQDIELTKEQTKLLSNAGALVSAKNRSFHARENRIRFQKVGISLAKKANSLFISGCMLYWAEGTKSRNSIRFTNSDPAMMSFFKKFLDTTFKFKEDDYKVYLNFFTDQLPKEEIEQYWLDLLTLPNLCLRKSQINYYSKYTKKQRTNKLKYGTCCLRVESTKHVQILFGAIQELGEFQNEEWI